MPESRLVVIMSDIEMGAGGPLDDFPYTEWLGERLLRYADENKSAIDLVFNGDTFDFLKTSVRGAYPSRITAEVAMAKLDRVQRAHPDFFAALRVFLDDDRGPRRVHFILGNHDMELAFPEVQEAIRTAIHPTGSDDTGDAVSPVHFPGFSTQFGELYIEHGMQDDSMFAIDPNEVFVTHRGEPVLALSWGAVALIDVAMPLQHRLWDLDRIKPRPQVLKLMPEVQDLLVNSYWQYWTQDWWQDFWAGTDPSKRVTWTLLRDVAYRFGTHDTGQYLGGAYKELIRERDDVRVCVIGHLHQPSMWSWLDRRVITTGCLRDEFTIDRTGRIDRRLAKTWAEVRMIGHRVLTAQLIDEEGPPMRPGQVPSHISEVGERIRDLVPSHIEQAAVEEGEKHQVHREAMAQAAGKPAPGPVAPAED